MSRNVSSKGWTEKRGKKKHKDLYIKIRQTGKRWAETCCAVESMERTNDILCSLNLEDSLPLWKKPSTIAVISSKRGGKKAYFLQVSFMFACQVLINLRYLAEFLPSAAKTQSHSVFFGSSSWSTCLSSQTNKIKTFKFCCPLLETDWSWHQTNHSDELTNILLSFKHKH